MSERGRPPTIWHAGPGKAFVNAVLMVQIERHPIKTVDAILAVLRKPEFAPLKRYPLRRLEKKFQEISYRNPYRQLFLQIRRGLKANYGNRIRGTVSELGEQYLRDKPFQ